MYVWIMAHVVQLYVHVDKHNSTNRGLSGGPVAF